MTESTLQRLGDALAELFWRRFPDRVSRVTSMGGRALRDGDYLTAWPIAAALLPIVAFLAGLAVGGFRPRADELFTFFVAWPAALLVFGGLGAGLGFWAWLGFAIGDFWLFPHVFFETDPFRHLFTEQIPLLIVYEVLLGLVVLTPLAASGLPDTVIRPLRRWVREEHVLLGVRVALAALVAAVMAQSWATSSGVLVRPIASFHGSILPPSAVLPMRAEAATLITVAVATTVLRVLLEWWVRSRGGSAASVRAAVRPGPTRPASRPAWRSVVAAVIGALIIATGLLGLLDSPADAPILYAGALAATLLRSVVLPRLGFYVRAIGHIPALVRVLSLGLVGYAVGTVILSSAALGDTLGLSFQPVLYSVVISMLVGAVLLPGPPLEQRRSEVAR